MSLCLGVGVDLLEKRRLNGAKAGRAPAFQCGGDCLC